MPDPSDSRGWKRAFQDGVIEPEDWAEQREQLSGELEGADAEAERLRASEDQIEREGDLLDAEQEVLEQLTAVRRAIAGELKDAAGLESVRAALTRLFVRFEVRVEDGTGQIKAVARDRSGAWTADEEGRQA
jgi:predicted phage gp36 major capsid-like protein